VKVRGRPQPDGEFQQLGQSGKQHAAQEREKNKIKKRYTRGTEKDGGIKGEKSRKKKDRKAKRRKVGKPEEHVGKGRGRTTFTRRTLP